MIEISTISEDDSKPPCREDFSKYLKESYYLGFLLKKRRFVR